MSVGQADEVPLVQLGSGLEGRRKEECVERSSRDRNRVERTDFLTGE